MSSSRGVVRDRCESRGRVKASGASRSSVFVKSSWERLLPAKLSLYHQRRLEITPVEK